MRLQLYATGKTHQMLLDFGSVARKAILDAAGEDGALDGLGLHLALREIEGAWAETFQTWGKLFEALRQEAAAIPFGTLAALHQSYLGQVITPDERRGLREQVGVGMVSGGWFYQQLSVLLDAANSRVYGDGLKLSERIWNLDQHSLERIRQVIYNAVASGNSAWNLASDLEEHLGAGAECPRWTRSRLYGLTKKAIAGGARTGLYSGDECAGQGVAYNALRLLRNEIQTIHHQGSDMVMARMPWVEQEEIHLSPSHPDIGCECEDVVVGGEDGTGVYPKGMISLPIHVGCLCFKTAVLLDPDEFVQQLRGWMTGVQPWRAMDDYADWLGVPMGQQIAAAAVDSVAGALVDWVMGRRGRDRGSAGGYTGSLTGIRLPKDLKGFENL